MIAGMMTATLRTHTGGLVARVEVPPFDTGFPPALVWGTRFFLRLGPFASGEYVETFCYHATVEVVGPRCPGCGAPPDPGHEVCAACRGI